MASRKDPAFLFYSSDFYEATRMMLPEERACYVDLLIYQHQHGTIPDDLPRLRLYCSGINEATLKATLKAKFKLSKEGWINERLREVVQDRKEYAEKQSINGRIGQVMKKAKKLFNPIDYQSFRNYFYHDIGKEKGLEHIENSKEKLEATLEAMLKASLKHLGNGNGNKLIRSNVEKIDFDEIKQMRVAEHGSPLDNLLPQLFFKEQLEKKAKMVFKPDKIDLAMKEINTHLGGTDAYQRNYKNLKWVFDKFIRYIENPTKFTEFKKQSYLDKVA